MGGATAICSDKVRFYTIIDRIRPPLPTLSVLFLPQTGTLTQNRMTVTQGFFCGKLYETVPSLSDLPSDFIKDMSLNISMSSKAFVIEKEGARAEFVGSSTECALLMMLKEWGHDYTQVRLNTVSPYNPMRT